MALSGEIFLLLNFAVWFFVCNIMGLRDVI
jgi:hypothetical protein